MSITYSKNTSVQNIEISQVYFFAVIDFKNSAISSIFIFPLFCMCYFSYLNKFTIYCICEEHHDKFVAKK